MKDNFGREINYLRISLTQRCNLNCIYCGTQAPDANELTTDEIEKLVRAFVKCGISKVRLTGGEPLMRNDIIEITERIKGIPGVQKLALTTNGVRLSNFAGQLKKAGLDAINISIDSLDPVCYKRLTGQNRLDSVLTGLDEATEQGFDSVKTNSVLIKGVNDNEVQNLINLAKNRKIDVRFIELMPFSGTGDNRELVVTAKDILNSFTYLTPCECNEKSSVATYYSAPGFIGRVGFITPVSQKFCINCNRVRLLADGSLRTCLGHKETYKLRDAIDDEDELIRLIKKAILLKPVGHNFECPESVCYGMNKIGG